MHRQDRRIRLAAGVVALVVALVATPVAWPDSSASAAAGNATVAADALPDLEMAPIYGVVIKTNKAGRKRIRFGTRAFNIGEGPLEVRGRARNLKQMGEVYQFISDGKGGGREEPRAVKMFYAGDGHNHWHVNRFINVEVYKVGALSQTRRIRKLGFCLIDLVKSSDPPPNASPTRTYGFSACGTKVGVDSITMGIAVGWADDYSPTTTYQWIDVTTLPKGVYRLCAKVNPLGRWTESNLANNFFWHDVWINAKKSIVEVRNSGRTPCGSYR